MRTWLLFVTPKNRPHLADFTPGVLAMAAGPKSNPTVGGPSMLFTPWVCWLETILT